MLSDQEQEDETYPPIGADPIREIRDDPQEDNSVWGEGDCYWGED